jgi:hypothetical protein
MIAPSIATTSSVSPSSVSRSSSSSCAASLMESTGGRLTRKIFG